jgi:hypothetical protein
MVYRQVGHGLVIESEIRLPGLPVSAHINSPPDLTVTCGGSENSETPLPVGPPTAQFRDRAGVFDAHRSTDGGYVLRFGDTCIAAIDESGSAIVVHSPFPTSPSVPWIVGGACVSFALTLRRILNLHASAVAFNGISQVIVGPRGFGKSLVSALACADGADLVTDDVCAAVKLADKWQVAPGTNVLRLRHTVETVQRLFPAEKLATSSDGRTLLTQPRLDTCVPVGRIVFVVPDGTIQSAALVDVPSEQALLACLSNLRTPGLRDNMLLGPQFEQAADLLAVTPSVMLRLPPAPEVDDIGRLLRDRSRIGQS